MKTKINYLVRARVASIVTAIAFVTLLTSCDVIDAPYEETPIVPVDTTSIVRNVLMEDFTGHYCGNCPDGTKILRQIEDVYGERLIVIAVHAGPLSGRFEGFPTDFRTAEGTEINNTFGNSAAGLPNGLINRTAGGGGIIAQTGTWAERVAAELAKKPAVDIKVVRSFDTVTKVITLNVQVKYLEEGTANDNIVAVLTESDYISPQLDYKSTPNRIEEYRFDHILRASFNGAWGEPLSTTVIPKGTTITKQLQYTIPATKTWALNNCDVVVYVHRHNTTKEVLQAHKVHLLGS